MSGEKMDSSHSEARERPMWGWKEMQGWTNVEQDARPRKEQMGMRLFTCQEKRMLRALHGRWPYRRSHCRDDLHWLVRVRPGQRWCSTGRSHSAACLPVCSRRPHGG